MPFRIALSGLNAASTDLQVIGNNVANASTTGFKKSRTEFADIYATTNLGVAANAEGYVFHANVDPVEELANMMSASRGFQNNVEVLSTVKQLMLSTIRMGQ